jgi:hypothetical protein
MGANRIIAQQGGGATSIYGPTMAAMSAYYRGGAAFGSMEEQFLDLLLDLAQ